jgi:broad specificity phosphatase PhoE
MAQARALGRYFVDNNIAFSRILSSDLTRAKDTAQALIVNTNANCSLEISQLLREQCFGQAEGAAYTTRPTPGLTLEEHYAKGLYPPPRGSSTKFPGGESRDELAARAQRAIRELMLPLDIHKTNEDGDGRRGEQEINVAIVSHGLTIRQLVRALLLAAEKPDTKQINGLGRQFLQNTGWARISVTTQPVSFLPCHRRKAI